MEQSAEIRELYVRFCEAMASGNTEFLDRLTSRQDGTLSIGTDPAEWWVGYDKVAAVFRAQLEAVGGAMPLIVGDPQAYREGTVGWVADQPRFRLPTGDAPFRLTCLFHQEDGEWKLVQSHASIGVANQDAFGQELPT